MFNGTKLCERADPVLLRFTHLQNAYACRVKRPGKTLKNRLKYRKKNKKYTYLQTSTRQQTNRKWRKAVHALLHLTL